MNYNPTHPPTPPRHSQRLRGDVGSVSLEVAILAPALLVLVISIVQGGLWFHARNLAQAGAQEGATAAASYTSTPTAGITRARAFLTEQAGDSLTSTSVTASGSTPTLARVEVTGRALSLLPGIGGMTVTASAAAPVEHFTSSTG